MPKPYDFSSETPKLGLEIYYDEFLSSRLVELETVRIAFTAKNYKVIAEFVHKWKGFSAPYGFGILGELAMNIETCLEQSDFEHCGLLLEEVEFYLTVTKKKE